jgi:hypothetical protein
MSSSIWPNRRSANVAGLADHLLGQQPRAHRVDLLQERLDPQRAHPGVVVPDQLDGISRLERLLPENTEQLLSLLRALPGRILDLLQHISSTTTAKEGHVVCSA